jgi:hypothetical protein
MDEQQERSADMEPTDRDELEDLDVSEQQAEDVRGGRSARRGKRGLE